MLSAKAIQDYLGDNGNHCPYCGSTEITGMGVDLDGDSGEEQVICEVCHKAWADILLVSVVGLREEDDPRGNIRTTFLGGESVLQE